MKLCDIWEETRECVITEHNPGESLKMHETCYVITLHINLCKSRNQCPAICRSLTIKKYNYVM